MFLVDMTFVNTDKLTPELTAQHRDYLSQHYLSNDLMFGGRKEPRTGGILISKHDDEHQLIQMLNSDPFIVNGVATYTITAFTPVMASNRYQELLQE